MPSANKSAARSRSQRPAPQEAQPPFGAVTQRWVVLALVVLVPLAYWSGADDQIELPKATLLALGALALVAVGCVRAITDRNITVPTGPWSTALGAFTGALLLATIVAPNTWTALVGNWGRDSGALAYAASIAVCVAVIRVFDSTSVRAIASAVTVVAGLVASYGLLQKLGVDPVSWTDIYGADAVIATLGNPNFAAGFLGVVAPVALGVALVASRSLPERIAAASVVGGAFAAAYLTESVQGPLAAALGCALVVAVWLVGRYPGITRLMVGGGLAGAAVVLLLLLLALRESGPLAAFGRAGNLSSRHEFWSAAVDMFVDHPLLGVGFSSFGSYYREYRSEAAATGPVDVADNAHSVPLGMFANGGVLLGLAYLAFVVLTAWVLIRGLRRLTGDQRLLLAGFGGGWLAYQAQSAVSIDQPALVMMHFVLAGAIVTLGWPPVVRSLAGAPLRSRELGGAQVAALAAVAVAVMVALWAVLLPFRASVAAGDAADALQTGDGNAALDAYDRAVDLAPWQARYWIQRGQLLDAVERDEQALASYRRAISHDARSYEAVIAAAQLADTMGDEAAADRFYTRAARLDPHNPSPRDR